MVIRLIQRLSRKKFEDWGKEGGEIRSKNLTPERRSEIARNAGLAAAAARKKKKEAQA